MTTITGRHRLLCEVQSSTPPHVLYPSLSAGVITLHPCLAPRGSQAGSKTQAQSDPEPQWSCLEGLELLYG